MPLIESIQYFYNVMQSFAEVKASVAVGAILAYYVCPKNPTVMESRTVKMGMTNQMHVFYQLCPH